jgi:hypothetical protein
MRHLFICLIDTNNKIISEIYFVIMKNHIWLNSQIIINAGQYFIGNSLIDELENEFSANDVLWNNLHQVRYKNNLMLSILFRHIAFIASKHFKIICLSNLLILIIPDEGYFCIVPDEGYF